MYTSFAFSRIMRTNLSQSSALRSSSQSKHSGPGLQKDAFSSQSVKFAARKKWYQTGPGMFGIATFLLGAVASSLVSGGNDQPAINLPSGNNTFRVSQLSNGKVVIESQSGGRKQTSVMGKGSAFIDDKLNVWFDEGGRLNVQPSAGTNMIYGDIDCGLIKQPNGRQIDYGCKD